MRSRTRTRVIGIGNPFRCDDAAGLSVARQLRGRLPREIEILECSGNATELMEVWRDVGRVILIDTFCSGSATGDVLRIDVSEQAIPANLRQTSTHGFGVAEAVELARVLKTLPQTIVLYGIEGANFEPGQTLSPAVQQAIESCCQQIEAEVGQPFNGQPEETGSQ